ncbi:MAG: hypothetical protein PVI92_00840 [Chromatiales bacterium]|jgi:hypothetical protein
MVGLKHMLRIGRQQLFAGQGFNNLRNAFGEARRGAAEALRNPPRWDSIEALECDWGITDANRAMVMRNLRIEIAIHALSVLVGLLLIAWWAAAPDARSLVYKLVPGILLIAMSGLRVAAGLWRYDVLASRAPASFPVWLGLKKDKSKEPGR